MTVGLLATQGIRGGRNRTVIERIKETGDIFWAESDRDWILEGANVHVSMIGFDDGSDSTRTLNGLQVKTINSDLTSSQADLTTARVLLENKAIAFIGTQKGGKFDLAPPEVKKMLAATGNPNERPNSDVLKPWANAKDVTGRIRGRGIIDFGVDMAEKDAAMYEMPFEYVVTNIKEKRLKNKDRDSSNETWWLHQRPRPEMRAALTGKTRYIATPRHSKHRLFIWMETHVLPDSALVVIARDDDYFFGVLQSRVHELWSRRKGTQVREAESGFRYTPKSTFETFPFPWAPGHEPTDGVVLEIAAAANELATKRNKWLNPEGIPQKDLKLRTLTELYNNEPTWLKDAHKALDEAVLKAYGFASSVNDDEILAHLLQLNQERTSSDELQGEEEDDPPPVDESDE